MQMEENKLLTNEEYIDKFNKRRERIIKKTGKRNFTAGEYMKLIEEDEKEFVDPFESDATAGARQSGEPLNVCISCEG